MRKLSRLQSSILPFGLLACALCLNAMADEGAVSTQGAERTSEGQGSAGVATGESTGQSGEDQRVKQLKAQILAGEIDPAIEKLAPYLGRGY